MRTAQIQNQAETQLAGSLEDGLPRISPHEVLLKVLMSHRPFGSIVQHVEESLNTAPFRDRTQGTTTHFHLRGPILAYLRTVPDERLKTLKLRRTRQAVFRTRQEGSVPNVVLRQLFAESHGGVEIHQHGVQGFKIDARRS